jgi:hypothetical protein
MIREILSDIFSPYSLFGERCLAAFVALTIIGVVILLGFLTFSMVDSVGVRSTNKTITIIEDKMVVPAYTTFVLVGKVMVPQHHPESYQLHFDIDGEVVSPDVDMDFFNRVSIGDKIEVEYGFGRLSSSHVPTKIRLVSG